MDEIVIEESEDEEVMLIASGYEWTCPECEHFNNEIEITEKVTCRGCKKTFKVEDYSHAYA